MSWIDFGSQLSKVKVAESLSMWWRRHPRQRWLKRQSPSSSLHLFTMKSCQYSLVGIRSTYGRNKVCTSHSPETIEIKIKGVQVDYHLGISTCEHWEPGQTVKWKLHSNDCYIIITIIFIIRSRQSKK